MGELEGVFLNGHPQMRLPNILNISVEGIKAEAIVREMDKRGISISSGSACLSNSIDISRM
jgi:cysteine desulfurase